MGKDYGCSVLCLIKKNPLYGPQQLLYFLITFPSAGDVERRGEIIKQFTSLLLNQYYSILILR